MASSLGLLTLGRLGGAGGGGVFTYGELEVTLMADYIVELEVVEYDVLLEPEYSVSLEPDYEVELE